MTITIHWCDAERVEDKWKNSGGSTSLSASKQDAAESSPRNPGKVSQGKTRVSTIINAPDAGRTQP